MLVAGWFQIYLFALLAGTVAHQTPLYVEFFRQEYWNGLPFPPPEDLPNPGIEPTSLAPPALAGGFFTTTPPGKPGIYYLDYKHLKHA